MPARWCASIRARTSAPVSAAYAVIHRADIHLSILEAVRQEPLIRFHTSTQIADVSQQGGRAEVVDTQAAATRPMP